ncbi:MAG: hypothetical protein ABL934_18020 [Lysobacteraceae bacterium]
MKSKVSIAIITLLILGAAGLYWANRHTDQSVTHDEQQRATASAVDTPAAAIADSSSPLQASAPSGIVDPKQFCGRKPACADDPNIPNNEQELRWMQQHGYPTKDELDRLARLSETELEEEAKGGGLTAMTELGTRMVERNDPNGLRWILQARDRGSIYAYYAQSKKEMNRTLGNGLVESGAFLRVAYMLGDYKAATALYRFTQKERLGLVELNAIDRRAASLYQTYARNRQPTPRPLE